MRAWLLLATMSMAACGGSSAGSDGADAGSGTAIDAGETNPCDGVDCAGPCFSFYSCTGGRVFSQLARSIPGGPCCGGAWVCETTELEPCELGCEKEGAIVDALSPGYSRFRELLCAGTPEPQVGDSCGTNFDCKPNRARVGDDGELSTTYLECGHGGTCVEVDPPEVVGWLQPCARASAPVDVGEVSAADGRCLIARDPDGACLRSGLSILCNFDYECPQGAFCLPQVVPESRVLTAAGACKSGPPGDFSDYECSCPCDWAEGHCDARSDGSTESCPCDPDCSILETACGDDRLCDPRCETGDFLCADPDCIGSFGVCDEPARTRGSRAWPAQPPSPPPACGCDVTLMACDGDDPVTGGDCRCDPDCYVGITPAPTTAL